MKFPKFLRFRKIEQTCEACGISSLDVTRETPTGKLLCPECRAKGKEIMQNLLNTQCLESFHVPLELKSSLEQLAYDPKIEERFNADIHRTVKFDDAVIEDNKAAGLSAYVDPFSVSHKSTESGSGKTYDTTAVFAYFPEEDIITVASQSPKVITHEQGELMTINENGEEEPLNMDDAPHAPKPKNYDGKEEYQDALDVYKIEKPKWDKKVKAAFDLIKFTGKIYILLETVPKETLAMLKSTMSHDGPRITHKFVDEHGHVHVVVLEGAPAFIFCSIDEYYYSEFATRVISDTPDTNEAKIRAGKKTIATKRSYPWESKPSQDKILFKALIRNIRDTIKKYDLKFINPFPNCDELIGGLEVRDMRDFEHFQQLLSAKPILSLFQRPIFTIEGEKFFVATVQDFINAEKHFKFIYETTQTNTDKRTLTFYHEYVEHHVNGATLKTIVNHIYDKNNPTMNYEGEKTPTTKAPSRKTARRYLERLCDLGWVDIREDEQSDSRELTYYPLKNASNSEIQTEISALRANLPINPDLKAKLIKDFKTWKETITTRGVTYALSKINFIDKTETPITEEEFDKMIMDAHSEFNSEVSSKLLPPDSKNKVGENNISIQSNLTLSNPSIENNKNDRVQSDPLVVIVSKEESALEPENNSENASNEQKAVDALISSDDVNAENRKKTLAELMEEEESSKNE